MPAAWRGSGEGVDLEFERAGLDANAQPDGSRVFESQWDSPECEHPDMNVLWPHRTLNDHRSRPFSLPNHGDGTGKRKKDDYASAEAAAKQDAQVGQLKEN